MLKQTKFRVFLLALIAVLAGCGPNLERLTVIDISLIQLKSTEFNKSINGLLNLEEMSSVDIISAIVGLHPKNLRRVSLPEIGIDRFEPTTKEVDFKSPEIFLHVQGPGPVVPFNGAAVHILIKNFQHFGCLPFSTVLADKTVGWEPRRGPAPGFDVRGKNRSVATLITISKDNEKDCLSSVSIMQ